MPSESAFTYPTEPVKPGSHRKSIMEPEAPRVMTGGSSVSAGIPQPLSPYDAWKASPTPQNMYAVVQTLSPQIRNATSGMGGNPLLLSEGRLLAAKAVQSYDPAKPANLQSHTVNVLKELHRKRKKLDNVIKTPERFAIAHGQMRTFMDSFELDHGREPTVRDISDYTGIPPKRVEKILSYQPGMSEGAMLAGDDESMGSLPGSAQDSSESWADFVYDDMTGQQQLVFDYTLGKNGKKRIESNRELAAKLKLSPGRVSQLRKEVDSLIQQGADSTLL